MKRTGLLCLALVLAAGPAVAGPNLPKLTDASADCVDCHKEKTPALYGQWGTSKHFRANVGCYECHKADPGDPDAFEHNDFTISTIVSPKDCGRWHENEALQFARSHQASAGKIRGSLDNVLGEVVEGPAAAMNGCKQCHGSVVKVLAKGKLDPATWPNTGMGRINPDGSNGACSACHSRHAFSVAQARRPENCGKCHLGPDHPQKEIYEESKHGIAYRANIDKMNLDNAKWIVGEDYWAAPTCATCHMSATRELPVTHDVGDRISWTLRPAISEKVDAKAKKLGKKVKPWEARRADMKKVCRACHAKGFTEAFYFQFDSAVELYNEKFAKPGLRIVNALKQNGLVTTDVAFDDEIEWTWFYLWHHEGRRARHGASMMAPDYTQWHGFYEVADRFYTQLVPQARELAEHAIAEGKEKEGKAVLAVIDEVLNMDDHKWFLGKMDPAEKARRAKAREEFKKRYAQ
ncbi:MAG: hydroxylamine oxidoreductase [Deltaproteobacteria bacterium]|nr:MAG: hydroxylamine oxidoreductase [Deltaproteobacteria bacterium]